MNAETPDERRSGIMRKFSRESLVNLSTGRVGEIRVLHVSEWLSDARGITHSANGCVQTPVNFSVFTSFARFSQ
jgi:hypothetical protein